MLAMNEVRDLAANTAERRELLRRAGCYDTMLKALEDVLANSWSLTGRDGHGITGYAIDTVRKAIAAAKGS